MLDPTFSGFTVFCGKSRRATFLFSFTQMHRPIPEQAIGWSKLHRPLCASRSANKLPRTERITKLADDFFHNFESYIPSPISASL